MTVFVEMIMPMIQIGERQLSYETFRLAQGLLYFLFRELVSQDAVGLRKQMLSGPTFGSHLLIIGELETAILEKIH